MLKKVTLLVALLGIGIFGVTFAVKNPIEVPLRYYFDLAWEGPLVIALLAALAIGFVLGLLTGLFRVLALRRELRRHRAEQMLSQDVEVPPPGSP
jgi:uncharacterized integral membrane protein